MNSLSGAQVPLPADKRLHAFSFAHHEIPGEIPICGESLVQWSDKRERDMNVSLDIFLTARTDTVFP